MKKEILAPFAGAALDIVKIAAAVIMIVDHVNTILLDGAQMNMWFVGRAAFPLFCFVTACHMIRGIEPGRYAAILLMLGVITQPIYWAAFGTENASVLFTLAAAVPVGVWLLQASAWAKALAYTAALASNLYMQGGFEYGLAGVVFPAVIAGVMRRDPWSIFFIGPLLFALNIQLPPTFAALLWQIGAYAAIAAGIGTAAVLVLAEPFRSGRRFLPRYALHIFYPAHLAALILLNRLVM